jgi:hypothetical protein
LLRLLASLITLVTVNKSRASNGMFGGHQPTAAKSSANWRR